MTPEPPDEVYLRWLYGQVAPVRLKNPQRTYWFLLGQLYSKAFVWDVPNDDNRVEDGLALRYEFIQQMDLEVDREWVHLPCSMLEMLIALSRRLAFEAEGQARGWFWHLMRNIHLDEINDATYASQNYEETVDEILDNVIWRRYDFNGVGGLFPLKHAHENQRKVELWYQMSAYLLQD
jgi:hypothetical protein